MCIDHEAVHTCTWSRSDFKSPQLQLMMKSIDLSHQVPIRNVPNHSKYGAKFTPIFWCHK